MTAGSSEPDLAYLTTSGRITGTAHRIEIWFALDAGNAYLLAGGGERSDWVRNLMVSPEVVLQIGDRKRPAHARVLGAGSEEDTVARTLLVEKYSSRGNANLSEWGKSALAVAIDWPD